MFCGFEGRSNRKFIRFSQKFYLMKKFALYIQHVRLKSHLLDQIGDGLTYIGSIFHRPLWFIPEVTVSDNDQLHSPN